MENAECLPYQGFRGFGLWKNILSEFKAHKKARFCAAEAGFFMRFVISGSGSRDRSRVGVFLSDRCNG